MQESDNEQQTTMGGDIDVTNVGLSLYPLIIMGIASLVPISFHFVAKFYSNDDKSSTRVQGNIKPTWRNPEVSRFNPECCPICLSAPTLPLATNCGHVFCGPCLRAVWRNSQQHLMSPYVSCPMCRAKLYEILPVDPEEVLFSSVMTAPQATASNANNYLTLYDFVVLFNETYHDVADPRPPTARFCRAVKRALGRVHTYVFRTGFQNPTVGVLLSMVTPVLYISEPNNIIGNAQPWGYVDDVLVMLLCAIPLVNYMMALHSSRRQPLRRHA